MKSVICSIFQILLKDFQDLGEAYSLGQLLKNMNLFLFFFFIWISFWLSQAIEQKWWVS